MDINTPPAWIGSWCYVYFLGAVIGALMVLGVLFTNAKKIGSIGILVGILGLSFNFLHGMTYFWICRKSLA